MKKLLLFPLLFFCSLSFSQDERTFPIHKKCDKDMNYEDTKACTLEKISDYIKVSFDYEMTNRVFLTKKTTKFQLDFYINNKGKAEHINAKAEHKAIAIEAIRLIKRMPKLKKPGTLNGEIINTPISLTMTIYF